MPEHHDELYRRGTFRMVNRHHDPSVGFAHPGPEAKLEGLLWAVGAITLASLVAVVVELVFASLRTGDELVSPLAERLAAVEDLLDCYSKGELQQIRNREVGSSISPCWAHRASANLQRSGYAPHYAEQMGAVVVLIGRLVDIAANPTHLVIYNSDEIGHRSGTWPKALPAFAQTC